MQDACDFLYQVFINKKFINSKVKLLILATEIDGKLTEEDLKRLLKDQFDRKIFALKGGEYQHND